MDISTTALARICEAIDERVRRGPAPGTADPHWAADAAAALINQQAATRQIAGTLGVDDAGERVGRAHAEAVEQFADHLIAGRLDELAALIVVFVFPPPPPPQPQPDWGTDGVPGVDLLLAAAKFEEVASAKAKFESVAYASAAAKLVDAGVVRLAAKFE
jgi:hypothetical protein